MITSVVIPCYKEIKLIEKVINGIPDFITHIIVVDDKCPQKTGAFVESLNNDRVIVLFNEKNLGVGGATSKGFIKAISLDSDAIIKMDGDGQMNPEFLKDLIGPIKLGQCDFTKGNRLYFDRELKKMPTKRLIGNSILSFLVKFSSGYWDISDPTNGFLCFSKKASKLISFEDLSNGYFFETDILINLNLKNCVIKDIQMPAKYDNEISSLNINKVLFTFPFFLAKGLIRRILYKYFIYDFNICSLYLLIGFPLFLFGLIFGLYTWNHSLVNNINTPNGTLMVVLVSLTFGFQLLIQAITFDIFNTPKNK